MERNRIKLTESDLRNIVKESVSMVLREMEKPIRITWKYYGTEVYVNGVYAGYIDSLGQNEGWYGRVFYTEEDGRTTMKSFGVSYDKTEIRQKIKDFINNNADNVLSTSIRVEELNK